MKQFALVVFACISFSFGWLGTAKAWPSTTITMYTPLHMQVIATASGSCWTTSIAIERPDAFRCMAGNSIHDPCFVTSKTIAMCPTDLLHDRGTRLNLTEALPPASSTRSGAAWAFELASGVMCEVGTGTVTPGYPYYCSTPPVCSSPKAVGSGIYEVRCGKPETPLTVGGVRTERVVRIWK
jgi:hypothetical protein